MNAKFIFMALLISAVAMAQNVYVIRSAGVTKINGEELLPNYKFLLDANDKIVLEPGARIVAMTRSKKVEVAGPLNKTNRAGLLARLNKQPDTESFFGYIANLYTTISRSEETKGSIRAGIKGLNDGKDGEAGTTAFDELFPVDSALVNSDAVTLSWRVYKKMSYPKLLVIATSSNDTVYNGEVTLQSSAKIPLNKHGYYKWTLYSKADRRNKLTRCFKKLTADEVMAKSNERARLKKQLANMSEETQQQLLGDYDARNKIIAQ